MAEYQGIHRYVEEIQEKSPIGGMHNADVRGPLARRRRLMKDEIYNRDANMVSYGVRR